MKSISIPKVLYPQHGITDLASLQYTSLPACLPVQILPSSGASDFFANGIQNALPFVEVPGEFLSKRWHYFRPEPVLLMHYTSVLTFPYVT